MSKELESMRELVQPFSSHKDIQMGEQVKLSMEDTVSDELADKNIIAVSSGDLMNHEQREDVCYAPTVRTISPRPKIQLERMKNENLLQPQDDSNSDTNFPGLEQELIQFRQAKEELQSIFPLSNKKSVAETH